jgi:hypothetical protein
MLKGNHCDAHIDRKREIPLDKRRLSEWLTWAAPACFGAEFSDQSP